MSVKVSIIIPTYNTKERYLTRLFDSIANQTMLSDCEIIIGDDCSTEANVNLLMDVLSKYDFPYSTVIQRVSRGGSGMAKQSALNIASGDYCLFLDSDDSLYDNASIETLYKGVTKYNSVMAMGDMVIQFDNPGKMYTYYTDGEIIPYTKVSAGTAGTIISRKFITSNNLRFMDTFYCENLSLVSSLIWTLNYKRTLTLYKPTYVRWLNEGSLTDFNLFPYARILEMDTALYGLSVMKDLISKNIPIENKGNILTNQLIAINDTPNYLDITEKMKQQLIYYYSFMIFKMYEQCLYELPLLAAQRVQSNILQLVSGYDPQELRLIECIWDAFLTQQLSYQSFDSVPFMADRPWNHKDKFLLSNTIK